VGRREREGKTPDRLRYEISWFDWRSVEKHADILRFVRALNALRMNRDLPVERIRPTTQVNHRDEDLLTRNDRHIGVLVVVEVFVLGRDLVDPRGDVAIERATRLDRTEIHPVHVDIGGVEALRGIP